jgi:hypothetical protein
MTTLSIIDCKLTPNSITVVFSEDVTATSTTDFFSATNPANYTVQQISPPGGAPQSFETTPGTTPVITAKISYDSSRFAAHITPSIPSGGLSGALWPWALLIRGNWIAVTVSNVRTPAGSEFPGRRETFPAQVNGHDDPNRDIHRTTHAVEDAVAYPVLTEEVGFPPSPLAGPPGARSSGRSGASLGQTVMSAVGDVLGWKVKADDPKGFVGALTASFTCADVDGHTQCTWTPRTYAVQSDLSGGITGAQASLYSRAQDALNQSLPLLDGLYPLDPEADAEDVAALKGIARSQLNELVNELGVAGGPRVSRVNQYFQLLLQDPGESFPPLPGTPLFTDPDQIHGTLGKLRDELGLNFTTQDFVNTVTDEQDLSNFRILSDYVTSLAQSWINNQRFFGLGTATPFFGTQLVLLSRQLSVVAESVDEVRFTLDSVFIGPAERQTLALQFDPSVSKDSLFAEDLFNWIQSFATDEGPRLIQDGGKYGVRFSFLPIARQLQGLVRTAHDPNLLDHGFRTFRVQRALKQLGEQLDELVTLASPISHVIEEEPTNAEFDAIRQQLALLTFQVGTQNLPGASVLIANPPQLIFAQSQTVDTESAPQPLTLFNVGTGSLTIPSPSNNMSVVGDGTGTSAASDFKLIEPDTFPISLAPQATLAVLVAFAPTAPGKRTALLNVPYNGTTTPTLHIPLTGTGVP